MASFFAVHLCRVQDRGRLPPLSLLIFQGGRGPRPSSWPKLCGAPYVSTSACQGEAKSELYPAVRFGAEWRLLKSTQSDRQHGWMMFFRLQASCMAPARRLASRGPDSMTMIIPGGGEDHRPMELHRTMDDYLGRIDFAGKHVLEIGPPSRFLTIEKWNKRSTDVVAVELPGGRRAETSCRFRKRTYPRSGRSSSLACHAYEDGFSFITRRTIKAERAVPTRHTPTCRRSASSTSRC